MKKIAAALFAGAIALSLGACGGGGASQPADAPAATAVEQLATVSGVKADFAASTGETLTGTVTLAEGDSMVCIGELGAGSVKVSYLQNGEELGSDEMYEGEGVGMMGMDPGEYEVQLVSADGATGTVIIAPYAEEIDFENLDTSQIIEQVKGTLGI